MLSLRKTIPEISCFLISRADGLTQPAPASVEDRTYDEGTIEWLDSQENYQVYQDNPDDPWYVEAVPETWTQAAAHNEDYSDVTIRLSDKHLNFFGPAGCSCNATAR